jgi:dienelactone hydrolase
VSRPGGVLEQIWRGAVAALLFVWQPAALAAEPTLLSVESRLPALWWPVDASGPRPAVIALHGCSGLYRRGEATGRVERRYRDYAARLNAAGIHMLAPDSFAARGVAEICVDRGAARRISPEVRGDDVRAALRWLAAQPQVDAGRIVLLGWSHGAMTVLAAVNAARGNAVAPLAGAVAFYPGCRVQAREPFALRQPLLLLLGEADDWTPMGPCLELAQRLREAAPNADLTVRTYADAHHGFDGTGPLRHRPEVLGGRGAHVGGHPPARAAALADFDAFLARVLR